MSKSILHIVPFAYNGGTEKDCFYYAKFDTSNNHEILVLGSEGPMSSSFSEITSKVTHLNSLNKGLFLFHKELNNFLKEKSYDAILYWSTVHLPLVRHALKNQKAKLAVHIGNPVYKKLKVIFKNKLLQLIYPSKIDTKLFACSEYVQKSLQNDSYLRTFESTFSHNPVEPNDTNPYIVKSLNKEDYIQLGMVARLDPIKDHKTVLQSLPHVLKEYPNLVFNIVGDGILKKELEDYAHTLNLSSSVIFHGNQNGVYKFLQSWDIFIYSTTLKEGLGNVVTEALCNGLPVVVSDLPMMEELIGTEKNGILFKSGDPMDLSKKIINLLNDNSKRKELSSNAFIRYQENFHPMKYIEKRSEFLFKI